MYKNVFVNQCGYLPGMQKKVTIRSEKPVSFAVMRSDGSFVTDGRADTRVENVSAKETDFVGDFSAVTEPGRYYIMAEDHSESETFTVAPDVYADVFQKSVAFFYLQRCGCRLPGRLQGFTDTKPVTRKWLPYTAPLKKGKYPAAGTMPEITGGM